MAVYISHPSFRPPSMKRRHSTEGPSPSQTKRPRVYALERGFSHMSLSKQQDVSQLPHASSSLWSSSLSAMEIEEIAANSRPLFLTRPDSVEEPISPPQSTDVKMKGTSWYEPEPDRIVITDLDSSDDDEDSPDEIQLSISPALLQRIRERDLLQAYVPPEHSQAMVLYRPLTIPPPSEVLEHTSQSPSLPGAVPEIQIDEELSIPMAEVESEVEIDEDKMDIEP